MTRPTKKPWKVVGREYEESGTDMVILANGSGSRIAAIWSGWPTKDQIAIAHLIAAAPDLLEALKAVEWSPYGDEEEMHCPLCERPQQDGHRANCISGAALTRAKGE